MPARRRLGRRCPAPSANAVSRPPSRPHAAAAQGLARHLDPRATAVPSDAGPRFAAHRPMCGHLPPTRQLRPRSSPPARARCCLSERPGGCGHTVAAGETTPARWSRPGAEPAFCCGHLAARRPPQRWRCGASRRRQNGRGMSTVEDSGQLTGLRPPADGKNGPGRPGRGGKRQAGPPGACQAEYPPSHHFSSPATGRCGCPAYAHGHGHAYQRGFPAPRGCQKPSVRKPASRAVGMSWVELSSQRLAPAHDRARASSHTWATRASPQMSPASGGRGLGQRHGISPGTWGGRGGGAGRTLRTTTAPAEDTPRRGAPGASHAPHRAERARRSADSSETCPRHRPAGSGKQQS
eukprot:gene10434-biopygen18299